MLEGLARLRVPLGFIVAAIVLYLATPRAATLAAGLPIALAGLAFRGAAAGVIQKNRELARGGPYRLTRNPLYFGSSLLALGFAIMSGNATAAIVLLLPSIVIYPTVIRHEERHLHEKFGSDFEQFRRSVPCFVPRQMGVRVFESFSFECYLANREYKAAIGFAAAMALLLVKSF